MFNLLKYIMRKINKYNFFQKGESSSNEFKNSNVFNLKQKIKIEESQEKKQTIKNIILFIIVIFFLSLYLYI